MPIRRSYADHGDVCASAHALDVVGDRWSVIVIRELMLGPKRFGDLLAGARGATPTTLTARLRELERAGIVEQTELPPPARVSVYQLTNWGRELEPILQALGRWAQNSPFLPENGGLTPDAAILALRTMADGPGPQTVLAFDLHLHDNRAAQQTQSRYRIAWSRRGLTADKITHAVESADAIACDSTVWTHLMFADAHIRPLLETDVVTSQGEGGEIAQMFLAHFRFSSRPTEGSPRGAAPQG